jgi:hypothetical protein
MVVIEILKSYENEKRGLKKIYDPHKDIPLFLVETGEASSTSNPPISNLLKQRRAYTISFCAIE